ncbi:MAG: class I SAM-dependent methyltransferase [Actinomycetota bacterium]|nr:class I SAM-dependent methyltransferase [Actinomycetota bacterium]
MDAFYTGDYFSGGRGDLGYYAYDWADANAERMWGLVQQWDPRLGVVPHTLLDVGCAHGSFALTAQRDGWATAGVELAAEARERAAKRGLRMFSSLEDAHGSYGLITMMHVLEHLIDPMAGLTAARQLIDPNGLLLIELPHWGSLGRRVRGCRWSQLKPPAHINFFERRSLDIALQSAGWLTMRSATVHEHFIDVASAELRQRHLGRGFAYAAAASALEHMGVAGNLRVVASPR